MKKYCFYYKGEKENPYDKESDKYKWWWYESMYFRNGLPENHKHWESFINEDCHKIPAIEFLMIAGDVPIETKGFLEWSVATTLGHTPLENFWFFREYGRGFLPEHLYTGELIDYDYSDEAIYSMCLYYKGEEENPFEPNNMQYTFWNLEKVWAKLVVNNEPRRTKYIVSFLLDFPDGLAGFPIDETLKATMYEQFMHFGGSKGDFCKFLVNYMSMKP